MRRSLEFIFGLIDDREPASASREDFEGPHGAILALFQQTGFLDTEPCMNPVPSCPHCFSGTPYRIDERYVCNRCRSDVEGDELHLWRFNLDALLRWFARMQRLEGAVERLDEALWRLGTLKADLMIFECFYLRGRSSSDLGRKRLLAYRDVLLLHGSPVPPVIFGFQGRILSLIELLGTEEEVLTARPLVSLLRPGGAVHFDLPTGEIRAGEVFLGRIPPGSREFHFVACLAAYAGDLAYYADLKRYVCGKTGSRDETDEATFCQKLKSRLKRVHGIAAIDRLIETDRNGGYRMRPELSLDAG